MNSPHLPDKSSHADPFPWLATALVALPFLWSVRANPIPDLWPWLAALVCFGLLLCVWPRRPYEALAWGWLVAALGNAAAGYIQHNLGLLFYLQSLVGVMQPGLTHIEGNLYQRNHLATLLAMGLVAALHLASAKNWAGVWRLDGEVASTTRQSLQRLWPWLAVAAVLGTALAFTYSRTGLLQLALMGLLAWVWQRKRFAWPMWLTAGLAYGAVTYFIGGSVDRALHENTVCSSRLILWNNVLQLILQRPWTGWGWGELDYAHSITRFDGPRFCEILSNAHNLPLHLAVELGIPVTVLIFALMGAWLWRFKPWRVQTPAAQAVVLGMVMLGVHSLLEYPLWYGHFLLTAVTAVLALSGFAKNDPHIERGGDARVQVPGRVLVGTLIIAAGVYAAWDFERVRPASYAGLVPDGPERQALWREANKSFLYTDSTEFSMLATIDPSPQNASLIERLAKQVLHYSPEPLVYERLIYALWLQNKSADVDVWLARYANAFPRAQVAFLARAPEVKTSANAASAKP